MMNLTVLAVGKLGERYLTDGCAEYRKRLSGFCKLQVAELPEHRLPERPSPAQIAAGLEREGDAILSRLPKDCVLAALCVEGDLFSSEELARSLEGWAGAGQGSVCFAVGGSFGLCERVKRAARLRLSMSRMTFPHGLARLMLLEQLYRAFSISRGGKYHK